MRRGLVATLLAGVLPAPGAGLRVATAGIHLTAIALLLGMLWAILARWRARGAGWAGLAAACLFATSPFLGLLGYHAGYP